MHLYRQPQAINSSLMNSLVLAFKYVVNYLNCVMTVLLEFLLKVCVIKVFVTIFGKTDLLRAFCISRNTNLKYIMHCASPVAQYSHARYLVCIVWLYSYHFIANSTSYLNAAGFSDSFFQLL